MIRTWRSRWLSFGVCTVREEVVCEGGRYTLWAVIGKQRVEAGRGYSGSGALHFHTVFPWARAVKREHEMLKNSPQYRAFVAGK